MDKLDSMIARLKSFNTQLDSSVEKVVRQNEELILEYNSEDQLLEQGIDTSNTKIASFAPYHPYTVSVKRIKGQPTNKVTLRDTGEFHESFYINYLIGGFEIKSNDEKAQILEDKYGEEIFGLSEENFSDFLDHYVLPEIQKLADRL